MNPSPQGQPPDRRLSNGLEQFFHALRDRQGLRILDLSGGSQANIQFVAEEGHKPTQDGFLHAVDESFGSGAEFFANQTSPDRVAQFCSMTLDHDEGAFQGILGWDALQYLVPPLLNDVVAQLHRITEPGGLLLLYFHTDERVVELPAVTYHIVDRKHVSVAQRGRNRPAKFLSNRQIEQLFSGFTAIKFFVTRDHLREVIVRR
jgi:SAM-dependent methyltransferase